MTGKMEDPKERLELLLAGLSGKKDVSDLCQEAGISRELYYRWLEKMKEGALDALEQKEPGPGRKAATPKEVEKLEEQVAKLNKKLAKARKETAYLGLVVKMAQKIIRRNAWGPFPARAKKNSARDEKHGNSTEKSGVVPGKMEPGKE